MKYIIVVNGNELEFKDEETFDKAKGLFMAANSNIQFTDKLDVEYLIPKDKIDCFMKKV